MAADRELREQADAFVLRACERRYPYNFTWMGVPVIQFPQDLVALQEVIFRVRPQLIVETGVAHGGGTIFLASMLELLGGDGSVVAIDVDVRAHNRAVIEAHPMSKRIALIEGSSADAAVIADVRKRAQGLRTLVVLDSNHRHAHVLAELRAYAPLVGKGGYVVVLDTIVERMSPAQIGDRPWAPGNSPMTAVREFLAENPRFSIDLDLENTLLISAAPGGYLRADRDP
ncbi:MAG: cephalosporin hydroxylase family protein [Candidatus Eremiobacteraeota bacterium]|nr:cephalosporin hydroxylase family protein [Candidatus Eremiobacteraeota bacterium]MBV8365835.1 cephalosporin hydroxylase family protein [Candidatus Eremiobacteraeota bacterium]